MEKIKKRVSFLLNLKMTTSWQSNDLLKEDYDAEVLSSMTTVLETSDSTHSNQVFPPFDFKLNDIKSRACGVDIDIQLHRMSFTSNDAIQGKLFLNCAKKNTKLGKIELRLVGFEGRHFVSDGIRDLFW